MNGPAADAAGVPMELVMSLTPDDLREFLLARESPAELVQPEKPTPTVATAAKALGVTQDEIIKTLLVNVDGGFVLAVAGGTRKLDLDRVAALAGGRKARLATPQEVETHTGFAPGGVPPVGHLSPVPVLVDSKLLYRVEVYGGGGDDRTLLRISPLEILRLTGGRAVPLSEEPRQAGASSNASTR